MLLNKNKNHIIDKMENLPLFLVMSFFIFHNIYIVFTGIGLSFYLINKRRINNFFTKYTNNKLVKQENQEVYSSEIKLPNIEIKEKEDSPISLVEELEESGYIRSLYKDRDNSAA